MYEVCVCSLPGIALLHQQLSPFYNCFSSHAFHAF